MPSGVRERAGARGLRPPRGQRDARGAARARARRRRPPRSGRRSATSVARRGRGRRARDRRRAERRRTTRSSARRTRAGSPVVLVAALAPGRVARAVRPLAVRRRVPDRGRLSRAEIAARIAERGGEPDCARRPGSRARRLPSSPRVVRSSGRPLRAPRAPRALPASRHCDRARAGADGRAAAALDATATEPDPPAVVAGALAATLVASYAFRSAAPRSATRAPGPRRRSARRPPPGRSRSRRRVACSDRSEPRSARSC